MWFSNGSHPVTSARLLDASQEFGDALRKHGAEMARGAVAGVDYARDVADDALASGRRVARSTHELVVARPMEALLLVGLASFAIGYVLRHMRKDADSERRARPRARASRARKS
jgi:hypothetical protein